MAAINFPSTPSPGDTHIVGDVTWTYDGVKWKANAADDLVALILALTDTVADLQTQVDAIPNTGDEIADAMGFVGGTTLVSAQTTAPTGWTKSVAHNNKALRLVSGTVSTGGSNPFTASFASRTPTGTNSATSLSTAQLASHQHDVSVFGTPGATPISHVQGAIGINAGPSTAPNAVVAAGSGSTHNHTLTGDAMDFAVTYVDVTIITKD